LHACCVKLVKKYGHGGLSLKKRVDYFWKHSDAIQAVYHKNAPIEAGLFDYNRLENR
jgi:hypothetical protein